MPFGPRSDRTQPLEKKWRFVRYSCASANSQFQTQKGFFLPPSFLPSEMDKNLTILSFLRQKLTSVGAGVEVSGAFFFWTPLRFLEHFLSISSSCVDRTSLLVSSDVEL